MTHADRRRADSFGAAAERYDRARPRYPDAMVDDLVGGQPLRVLDVGCGTGIATAAFAARDCQVLGVEPDERMAEIARAKGFPVEVSRFETWDPAGRTFDLVVSGQAWHWIEPGAGLDTVARCLEPGGTLAMFWNLIELDETARDRLEQVYASYAPHLIEGSVAMGRIDRSLWTEHLDALTAHPALGTGRTRSYEWTQHYSPDSWVDLISTHSDHATLDDVVRKPLLVGVREAIGAMGGSLTVGYTTVLVCAQRVDGS